MRLRSLLLLLGSVLLAFALQMAAQRPSSPGTDEIPLLKANARAVLVDVVVTDSHGNPVTGLHQQDFKLTENGKPESVVFFRNGAGFLWLRWSSGS